MNKFGGRAMRFKDVKCDEAMDEGGRAPKVGALRGVWNSCRVGLYF